MDSTKHRFYKSERGYRAMTSWYDSLVDKFTFQFDSEYVNTRFGRTHMITAGPKAAAPLILVQAIAGSAPLWYHQIPFFANHYLVYALDTPGQPGRSDPRPPPILKDGYSDWLLDVLDALEIQCACLAGVSSGGWHVIKLAIRAPERTKKIAMISPTGLVRARFPIKIWLTNVVSKKKTEQELESDLSTRSFMPSTASREFDLQLARAMALATRHYRLDKSLGMYEEEGERINPWQSMRVMRALFFAERRTSLSKLRIPGLVILGEHEMLYNAQRVARKIRRSMPTLDVEIIPETGHSAMYDQPQVVNRLILAFLQQDA
jgi:pimeloyl-ACP methyl ester carboxylesterase